MADDIASQLEGAVESLGRFRDSLEDNNIRMGNASSIEAKIHKLEVDKLKLLEKANKEVRRFLDLWQTFLLAGAAARRATAGTQVNNESR